MTRTSPQRILQRSTRYCLGSFLASLLLLPVQQVQAPQQAQRPLKVQQALHQQEALRLGLQLKLESGQAMNRVFGENSTLTPHRLLPARQQAVEALEGAEGVEGP